MKRRNFTRIALIALVIALGVPISATAKEMTTSPAEDIWGLYRRGELIEPVRDDADVFQLEFGWPRRIPTEAPMWGRSPTIVDIDQNGDWEIAVVSGDGRLFVYQHNGALFPGFPTQSHRGNRAEAWEDPTHRALASVGDIDRDSSPDLIYPADIGYLHVVGRNQHEPNPFPVDMNHGTEISAVVTLDIDGDRGAELIFTTFPVRADDGNEALLHILDGSGSEIQGWPVRCGFGSGSSPAVGDIDGDGLVEIIIASGRSGETGARIYAFKLDGTRVNGFPQGDYESIGGSVILASWDDRAGMDIIFAATPRNGDRAALYALSGDGSVISGFPRTLDQGHPFGSPIVFGDRVGNRYSEIGFGGFNSDGEARIQIFRREDGGDSLIEVSSTGVEVGVVGSLAAADVLDGGSDIQIISALAPTPMNAGRILIIGNDENQIIDLADYGDGAFASSPTLWDVDRDGNTEIIAVTTDGRLFVWHTEGAFDGEIWPTERGTFTRSGAKISISELAVGREPGVVLAPEFFSVTAYPNPFNRGLNITIRSSESALYTLNLFDMVGREMSRIQYRVESSGMEHISLDLGNLGMSPGVYFMRCSVNNRSWVTERLIYLP